MKTTTRVLLSTPLLLLGLSTLVACSGSSAPPAVDSTTGAEIEQQDTDVFTLEIGDCLNDATAAHEVSELPLVDCAEEHDSEVYYEFDLPDDNTFPAATIDDDAAAGCEEQFESFVGIPYEESTLTYGTYQPTAQSWTGTHDRAVSCVIADPAGKVKGTLKGAAR
ncbi:septum formation family protein [Cnuibacter physcomitrellae]|uniref:septum formation family protein n=1 Tax=Cnuibacter physcomitrellae TaxID=1619308 RepID=UPI002176178A|nr:septum formation family protein [Cnuibacter physcomitrellae]MCS5496675.1 septum formation family protein [Cnuibacter physcomitrellae]